MQKLNLFNPLTYKREEFTFNSLLKKILLSPKGSDSFILYSLLYTKGAVDKRFTRKMRFVT